jgi:hypothetical protein
MGFDWGDETYKFRVHVIPAADGRYTWRLVVHDRPRAEATDSFEEGKESFDTPDAAEEAGKYRMVELARQDRNKPT